MRMIPCELTLGNGGDVVAMVRLDDDGVPHPDPAAESPCGQRGDTQPRLCHGP